MQSRILISVALTFALAALAHYPPHSGALVVFLAFGFVSFILWLDSRPKEEAPAIRGLRSEIAALRTQTDEIKGHVERVILRGRG